MIDSKVRQRVEISQQELKKCLHYDPITGIFTRIESPHEWHIGKVAGGVNSKGYIRIKIERREFFAHRLAWLYVYGYLPKEMIDHKNGNRLDNRICNLREATRQDNNQNRKVAQKNNTSGFLGVHKCNRSVNFVASISINGKKKCIGRFSTAEEAFEEYVKAKRKIHGFCTI